MMTKAQFERILQRLKEQNIQLKSMMFSGGEPMLWPYLSWAIKKAKESGIVEKVKVFTNGIKANLSDFDGVDKIQITNYGAINKLDILRLKKQGIGRRLIITNVVHLDWPFKKVINNTLPAICPCVRLYFLGDKVGQCNMQSLLDKDTLLVEDDFIEIFNKRKPLEQEICKGCLGNIKVKNQYFTDITVEFGIWDTGLYWIFCSGFKGIWIRNILKFLRRKYKKIFLKE